jgi:hypothetical protein
LNFIPPYEFAMEWFMAAMLPRASRFVLEVLPFLLSGLIAVFILSGYLHSRAHASEAPAKLVPSVVARGGAA